MKNYLKALLCVSFLLATALLVAAYRKTPPVQAQELPATPSPASIQTLTSDLMSWYNANAVGNFTASASDFGAYVMHAVDDELYVGLNRRIPTADVAGPILAKHDGDTLSKVANLPEDSVFRIKSDSENVYVPGYDPAGGDGWDAGNFYMYNRSAEQFTKKRYRYNSWQFVDAVTTDANGNYSFTNLKNTTYRIRLVKPAGYTHAPRYAPYDPATPTLAPQLSGHEYDSNFSSAGELVTCTDSGGSQEVGITLQEPFTDTSIDGGLIVTPGASAGNPTPGVRNEDFYTGTYSIASRIWNDIDADGRQDAGEPGIPGVRVEVLTRDPYFPCAIHMPAMWADDNEIYVNYGFTRPSSWYGYYTLPAGANATYKSTDHGETWELVGESSDVYYSYDMEKLGGQLYKLTFDMIGDYTGNPWLDGFTTVLNRSQNNGATWSYEMFNRPFGERLYWQGYTTPSKVHGLKFPATVRLQPFQDSLVMPGSSGTELIRFSADHQQDEIPVTGVNFKGILSSVSDPDFRPMNGTIFTKDEVGHLMSWNTMANAQDEYLYAIGEGKKVYVTKNLTDWVVAADFSTFAPSEPVALEYWPEKNWVMVATTGTQAGIHYFDHAAIAAWLDPQVEPTPLPTPEPTLEPTPEPTPSPELVSTNIVRNGSFELVMPNTTKPDFWWERPGQQSDTSTAYSGNNSFKISEVSGNGYTYQNYSLKQNTTYTMTAWVKSSSPSNKFALRFAMTTPSQPGTQTPGTAWDSLGNEWQMVQKVFTTPAEALTLSRFDLVWTLQNGETIWVDEVSFCEGDQSGKPGELVCMETGFEPPTPEPDPHLPVVEASASANILQNYSFELDVDRDGTPDTWTASPVFSLDSTTARSGQNSLKITPTNAAGYSYQNVQLQPNTTYTMTAWAKTNSVRQGILLRIPLINTANASTVPATLAVLDANNWTKIQKVFTTPPDLARARLDIFWWLYAGEIVWVDDIELCEGDRSQVVGDVVCGSTI